MSRRTGRRRGAAAAAALVMAAAGGCSSDERVTSTTTVAGASLRVDWIADAIEAVEDQLGGAQRYYEINATPALVNLFVATEGAKVTPYAFLGGALTSADPAPAQGNTFAADAIDFDPDKVTATVTKELPTSTQDVFAIEGGPDGAIRYTILVTSAAGGKLLVTVSGEGAVLAVDPL